MSAAMIARARRCSGWDMRSATVSEKRQKKRREYGFSARGIRYGKNTICLSVR